MFHKIGKDIKLSYNFNKIENLHLFAFDKDCRYDGIIASFCRNTFEEPDISERINKLLKGSAEETFNNYLIKKPNEANEDSLKQEVLNSFDSFNKSLEQNQVFSKEVQTKQSFLQRLFGKIKID